MLWCKGNQSDEFPRRLARVLVCFEHMRSKMARKNHESFATLVIQGFFQSRSQRIYQRDGENIGGSLCQATGQRRLGLSRMLSSIARTSHILSRRESFRLARHCLWLECDATVNSGCAVVLRWRRLMPRRCAEVLRRRRGAHVIFIISTTVQAESTQEPKKTYICLENAFPSQKCIFDYNQKVLKIKK
jgi:hypothetical protein